MEKELLEEFRVAMAKSGMNQGEVATSMGISQSYFSRLLNRDAHPSKLMYCRIKLFIEAMSKKEYPRLATD